MKEREVGKALWGSETGEAEPREVMGQDGEGVMGQGDGDEQDDGAGTEEGLEVTDLG